MWFVIVCEGVRACWSVCMLSVILEDGSYYI